MIPDSLQIRRVAFGYVYPNAPSMDRAANLDFYDRVTNQGIDLPEMIQQQQELVLLNRASTPLGRSVEVRVGPLPQPPLPPGVAAAPPLRLLFAEEGSTRPLKLINDAADAVHSAFRVVWGPRAPRVSVVEASFVATVSLKDQQDAIAFLRNHVSKTGRADQQYLGREFSGIIVKVSSPTALVIGPAEIPKGHGPSLPGAEVDLQFEPFAADVRLLQVTVISRWQSIQLPIRDLQVPPQVKASIKGELLVLNAEEKAPSEYSAQVYSFLEAHVLPFLGALAR